MVNERLQALEARIDALLEGYAELAQQSRTLEEQNQALQQEKAELLKRNDMAQAKVEAMITRLKTLEQDP